MPFCQPTITPESGNVGADVEVQEDSTIFPVFHDIKTYCAVTVELLTAALPLPTVISLVIRVVGAAPLGLPITGATFVSAETVGNTVDPIFTFPE